METRKIIEELESIEAFAQLLLQKCYSVRLLLSPGDFHSRASFKTKSQHKINQVIANRNKCINKKSANLKNLIILLCFFNSAYAQNFYVPQIDSLYSYIEQYYKDLTASQIEEFKSVNKYRILNYIPSPGYSPFTGGFSLSFNLSGPIQEIKFKNISKHKTTSIEKINKIQCISLKNNVFVDFKALELSISEFHAKDTLVYLKQEAFNLAKTQYSRNELTPTEYLARQYEIESLKVQRMQEANSIDKALLQLLLKAKIPVHSNAPVF